jgi:hypothetical protein
MTGETIDEANAIRAAKKFPGLKGMDLAKAVTTKRIYQWNDGPVWKLAAQGAASAEPPARRRLRLRHQAQHSADPLRAWLPHDGSAGTNSGRSSACNES